MIPDYSKFKSVEDLYEAYSEVNMDEHPERLQAIIDEVEKRQQFAEVKEEFDNFIVITRARLLSYLMDLILHWLIVTIITLILFAVIESFTYTFFKANENIFYVVSICLYFLYFEGRGKTKASLGKTFFKIQVVDEQGHPALFSKILLRTIIFTFIFFISWSDVIVLMKFDTIWVYVISILQVCLILYNLWLVKYSSDGLMLHDKISGTQILPIYSNTNFLLSQKSPILIETLKVLFVLAWVLLSSYVGVRLLSELMFW